MARRIATTIAEARAVIATMGLPVVLTPAFALVCSTGVLTPAEIEPAIQDALSASATAQVLIEPASLADAAPIADPVLAGDVR
jgi:carbamoylphosphate synthase large subunit